MNYRAVTTVFILGGGGLEVPIGGDLTMVEADELRKFYDFQTSKHAITGPILLNLSQCHNSRDPKVKDNTPKYLQFLRILIIFLKRIT